MWDPKRIYENREHPAPGPALPHPVEELPVITRKNVLSCVPAKGRHRKSGGGSVVQRRRDVCRMLGFQNYRDYLASPLWRKIRRHIFGRAESVCECCHNAKAVVVHHLNYDAETMAGHADDALIAVCQPCHDNYHSSNGKKRSPWKKFKPGSRDRAFRRMIAREAKRRKRKNGKLFGVRIATIDTPVVVAKWLGIDMPKH